jgi:hypothetical protein
MIARWLAVGFGLWLIITLAFLFLGNADAVGHPLGASAGDVVPWLLMVLPFVIFALTYFLLAILKVDPADRAEATGIMALPGLLIGIYEINSFAKLFPDIGPVYSGAFAGLMYSCYAAAILAGVVSSRLQQSES